MFDPYRVSRSLLPACGEQAVPLRAERPQSRGGKALIYRLDGLRVGSPIPPTGFVPVTASAARLAEYGALGALVIPATAATASSAATARVPAFPKVPAIQISAIQSEYDNEMLLDHGQGNYVTMSNLFEQSNYYPIRDGSSKWYEIQDTAGSANQCLSLAGGSASSGVFYVDTEFCNFRSAELWWFPSGVTNTSWAEIINQYGTKLLNHYACLYNNESGQDPKIQGCSTSNPQPSQQLWQAGF